MRIGIDARFWSETGVGRYIRNLIINLQIIDKQNDYVLFIRDEDYGDVKLRISNLKFKIANCNIKWHTVEEQVVFSRILNKHNLDLVHFPYYSVPVFYNRPFVVTIHDLIPLHFQTGKASTLPLPLYRLKLQAFKFVVFQAAKKAKKIITPSIASKKDVEKFLKSKPSKIKVIYEGVDGNLKSGKNQRKENLILYIGNAYPHKNLETLLLAFKNSNLQNTKLVLIGKDDYFYKRLRKKANEFKVGGLVEFHGEATESELLSFYKKAKVLVIPSLLEGFGLPVLEAMANNCLVLASDIPVLHEVGGDAAIYFNPNDVGDLSTRVKEVFEGKYSENISKGLQRVRNFSWRKTAEETLRVYKSCV